MTLTVEQYDRAENEARTFLSFSEIMAYSPKTFEMLGLPARVSDPRELARYADWNFDPGNQDYFRPGVFLRGPSTETTFTADEARMINSVCDRVVELTSQLGGPCVRPLCNPLSQIGLFRILTALRELYGQELSVLEIGPGSGYLGAYLGMHGYRYASVDNAQALYLWQNRLLESLFRGEFADWAAAPRGSYPAKREHRIVHLPWWQFVRLYDNLPIAADVVVSNTNLGEMSNAAMKYSITLAKKALSESNVRMFVYTDIGDPKQNTRGTVESTLADAGFERIYETMFNGWVLRGKGMPKRSSLEKRIPLFNPSGGEERLAAVDFLFLPPDQHPLDLAFTRIVQNWSPPVATDQATIDVRYRAH